MFTFLEKYLSHMSGKSMPVDLDHVKPFTGFCTALLCHSMSENSTVPCSNGTFTHIVANTLYDNWYAGAIELFDKEVISTVELLFLIITSNHLLFLTFACLISCPPELQHLQPSEDPQHTSSGPHRKARRETRDTKQVKMRRDGP